MIFQGASLEEVKAAKEEQTPHFEAGYKIYIYNK